ncbi:phosphatidylinositol-3,4,5-trisphosphate 3-phosphatase [Rhodotorula toruloides]|uniref:phosphatidylinositol-3,4,5-trisphosphate 3-phosphatase n=1 Tax=Rhodotorula toruloides TaxID=5286 RepID=A0A511KL90_RHOTO|nr:phosphatidylinositol-3,4,5-trisphosphate 3-phosphatase [Rhodotorula toruloides]
MLDPVRRLVSGRKARYTEDGFDLDLCRLTDRIIIMGYPATGTASLYRNKRSDVIRFLQPYAPRYRIFNLCPLYENSYEASAFVTGGASNEEEAEEKVLGGPVERYPWPDHHPPPLSMVPVMAIGARRWYEKDERNVVVIHCKAGKGRSGTFALSLLLALPGLPPAPALTGDEKAKDANDMKAYGPLDPHAVLAKPGADVQDLSLEDKLEYLLRFHTLRRMSPAAKRYGVSIASQRRWLGYWVRLLKGEDPRDDALYGKKRVVLEYVKVRGPGLHGVGKVVAGGNERIAVQVLRYKDSIAASLRERELALARDPTTPTTFSDWDDRSEMFVHVGTLSQANDTQSSPLLHASTPTHLDPPAAVDGGSTPPSASASTGSLPSAVVKTPASSIADSPDLPPPSQTAATPTSTCANPRPSQTHVLVPRTSFMGPDSTSSTRRTEKEAKATVEQDGGIVLDADRELQLKFLVGKTGDRHGKLPEMAALAITWFIPSFEATAPMVSADHHSKLVISGKDLDFRKPFAGIDQVEVGWRWLS